MAGAWSQTGADSRRSAAGPARPMTAYDKQRGAHPWECERCGTAVLKQLVGRRAALNVTADAEPVTRERAAALVEPNRLAWCLVRLRNGSPDLRWRCRNECGHAVAIEHRCPTDVQEFGRRPEGAMW
ncbi:hypothetical protein OG252_13300 [Streptomyces sp. NBC_01352]|uniref:hypothetical protein n=1 Tax=Streptomyces sp. NBC_01352 TaxID=2903834 RepID=UPI002E3641AB|nr:hypothetical protein [Streptomyces sp. NBC_01352]